MLTLNVVPERSIGCDKWEFIVGMHFSQAVSIIQSQTRQIKNAEVLYNETNPLDVDLVLNLPQDGIRLFFDATTQCLKIIEIYNMKLVKLLYCNIPFNSPEVMPSIEQIEHSFGATHPGVYNSEKELFILNFRGLTFYFPVESRYQSGETHNMGSLQFPPGSSPLVSRMAVYSGSSIEQAKAPEVPLNCYHGQVYLKRATVLRTDSYTRGIKLVLLGDTNNRRLDGGQQRVQLERTILLGSSVQDVAAALGAPSELFYKSEDKMRIHTPNELRRDADLRSDYFFNYFTLGLDVLFDARTHTAKKLVMHTNYPGHYNFNIYMRCEFKLTLNGAEIDAYCPWDDVCKRITPSERPVVLNRASSTNTTNPFGSTLCYGYQDIIFEVMPNNRIASVTVYGDGGMNRTPPFSECHETTGHV